MIVKPYNGIEPVFGKDVFIAPNAVVIGDVVLGDGCSVWYGAVLRGDVGKIRVGECTNIQDLCMLHETSGRSECVIGSYVTVGHRVILHGCVIEDRCLIGMGAVIMDNAVIGTGSIVAAGAVVLENTRVPPGSLVTGVPAKIRDTATEGERFPFVETAERYRHYAATHSGIFVPEDPNG